LLVVIPPLTVGSSNYLIEIFSEEFLFAMPPFDELPNRSKGDSLLNGRNADQQQQILSQSVLQEMKLGSQRVRNDESVFTKIGRELDVVAGGTAVGTYEHGREALTDPATLVKLGSSALIATGLTLAQGKKGVFRLSAQVAGLAMAGAYAGDVYGKGEETWGVMKDTWNSPENTTANKNHIKNTLGPFVVDFGIYSAGGAIGVGTGKFAASKLFASENRLGVSIVEPKPGESRFGASAAETTPGYRRMDSQVDTHKLMGPGPTINLKPEVTPTGTLMQIPGQVRTTTHGSLAKAEVAAPPTNTPKFVEIPVVEPGQMHGRMQQFPAEAPLSKVYERAKAEVGKIEVLSVAGEKIEARTANATSLGEGKLVTNYHVVENATDIYIMDAAGKAHKAHTVAYDREPDLAIVQLSNRDSWGAFNAANVKPIVKGDSKEGAVVAIGHFDGQNALHASPGLIPAEWRQTPLDLRFMGCIREGNCGGPLYNMNGEVLGVIKAGTGQTSFASPAWHFERIMQSGTKVEAPAAVSSPKPAIVQDYKVENVQSAKDNIAAMFDTALSGPLPPEFFHSKIKRVPIEVPGSATRDLILKTQISPGAREIVVEPIAFGGKPLTHDTYWPGTELPIAGSRLSLKFDPMLAKAEMQSVNDPHSVLKLGFAFRSESSYLAALKPVASVPISARGIASGN
jgi:hypothetical protein